MNTIIGIFSYLIMMPLSKFQLFHPKNCIICLLIVTVSCNYKPANNNIESQIEGSKSETIELHDTLMSKIGSLQLLTKALKKMESDSLTMSRNDSIKNALKYIENADKSMWDWMHNYDANYQNINDSVTLEYYQDKLRDIGQVKLEFDSAISKGRRLQI